MKTTLWIPLCLMLLGTLSPLQSQRLKNTVKRSLDEIGATLSQIPREQQGDLNKLAREVVDASVDGTLPLMVFDAREEPGLGPLLLVFSRSGLLQNQLDPERAVALYEPAGYRPATLLEDLEGYGFEVKRDASGESFELGYGTGSWRIEPVADPTTAAPGPGVVRILVSSTPVESTDSGSAVLVLADDQLAAGSVLYLTRRIKNLLDIRK